MPLLRSGVQDATQFARTILNCSCRKPPLRRVQEHEGNNVRRLCMHCEEPACASACLVGALKKTSYGPVVYDKDKCIGCRYCMIACPNSVPKYEWSKLAPYVKKCDMCWERVAQGQRTACAEACPTGATFFGIAINSCAKHDAVLTAIQATSSGSTVNVSLVAHPCSSSPMCPSRSSDSRWSNPKNRRYPR